MSVATCSFSVVFILGKHFVYCLEIKKMTQIKRRAASAIDGRSICFDLNDNSLQTTIK